jgi:outer membrane lipoprotein carrier protein
MACLAGLMALASQIHASDVKQTAIRFFESLENLEAEFHQTVYNSEQQFIQDSSGTLWIQRPGKFRWDYLTPYRQQIVSDGKKLWSYDEDLEQVTVQPLSDILSATPAMLLSGEQPLTEVFNIEDQAAEAGQGVLRLIPKTDAGNIVSITLVFNKQLLSSLEATDTLGNTTTFKFSAMKRNGPLDSGLFDFTPPENADVIGNIN